MKTNKINEFHSENLIYQYSLIFPYGEDGIKCGRLHIKRPNVKIKKRNCFIIMD